MTLFFPEASEIQKSLLRLLTFSSYIRDLNEADTCLAEPMMNRGNFKIDTIRDDWWKTEMLNHEHEVWIAWQILISQYVISPGVSDPLAAAYYVKPSTTAEKRLCGVQKMKKSGEFA
ncbi:hypothetical protein NX059_004153 [Plenodomus lindquistii]|nr:hypothetical protein NX059_004153 [Plenodomus lindquistii]